MKLSLIIRLIFALSFSLSHAQGQSSALYEGLDLRTETKALCRLVDGLQQGSYHYFDCLHHAKSIINGEEGLISGAYKICHESWIYEPTRCHSALSKNYYSKLLLEQPAVSFTKRLHVEERLTLATFGLSREELRSDSGADGSRVSIAFSENFDLADGWKLNLMDTVILVCSQTGALHYLLYKDESESYKAQKRCFKEGFRYLEDDLNSVEE